MTPRRAGPFLVLACLILAAAACGSEPASAPAGPTQTADSYLIGEPQNRASVGDVDRAFLRFETTRADLISLFRAQAWFQDGLSRDESLFVERSLSFVARYGSDRGVRIDPETVRQKLYLYERVQLSRDEVELLLVYEPGQDARRQMALLTAALPTLEGLVGVRYPERVMTVFNGSFGINDFNDGQFIRIDRCCLLSAFVLAHELAHSYWAMGPSWFNEGMADIYAVRTLAELSRRPPEGWSDLSSDLDAFHGVRKERVESGRFPDLPLARRFAADGLYEVADVFLLDLRQIVGPQRFDEAAREIYLLSDFGRYILREKRMQDVFMAVASPEERQQVSDLFNRVVWGDNGEQYERLRALEGS